MKRIIFLFAIGSLINSVFAQELPKEDKLIEILDKTYNWKFKNFNDEVILKTKQFPLRTKEYFGDLILKKVLEIKSYTNGVYEYNILEPYKQKYLISLNNATKVATVKSFVIYNINPAPARVEGSNIVFWVEFLYNCSPFYDTTKFPEGITQSTVIPNIQIIPVNKIWKIKDPTGVKKKILSPGYIFH